MKRISSSRLFFAELMINLLFFCVSAAVCVAVLAEAGNLTEESDILNEAVCEAQNAAEIFRNRKGDLAETAEYLGAELADGVLQLPLKSGYRLFMTASEEDGISTAMIKVGESGKNSSGIFSLKTGCCTGAENSETTG